MNDTTASAPRTRLGRSRWGGGAAALVLGALLIALVLAGSMGALYAWLGESGGGRLRFAVMAAVTLPIGLALGWALLVDRSSVRGAAERPEESVESAWYQQAAEGTMRDMLITLGLGAAAFSITGLQVDSGMLLAGAVTLMMLSFLARYQLAKRADA
ncbi:hypothetical protein [Agrococcus beijingensis]|uniref:hypothetical protein n=1 Tax=Agrococcus beijingensis TaxID=3068634 RepID=UPI0027414D47|nr:hypothetical protein [Agrococcus sp. REN33]